MEVSTLPGVFFFCFFLMASVTSFSSPVRYSVDSSALATSSLMGVAVQRDIDGLFFGQSVHDAFDRSRQDLAGKSHFYRRAADTPLYEVTFRGPRGSSNRVVDPALLRTHIMTRATSLPAVVDDVQTLRGVR